MLARSAAAAALAAVLALAACSESPTAVQDPTDAELVELSLSVPEAAVAWADQEPTAASFPLRRDRTVLDVLLRRAVLSVARTDGREAARAALETLRPRREAIREARGTGDRAAVRAAVEAYELAVAGLVVAELGPEPAARTVALAGEGLARLAARIAAAEADGHTVPRLRAALERLTAIHEAATAALQAGSAAQALALDARVVDVLARAARAARG